MTGKTNLKNQSMQESSRPTEPPHQSLTDPDVNLSVHPAPIDQPQVWPRSANARKARSLCALCALANKMLFADVLEASCISSLPI